MSLEAIECLLLALFLILDTIIAILNAFIFFLNQTGRRLTNKLYEVKEEEEDTTTLLFILVVVLFLLIGSCVETFFFFEIRTILPPLQQEEIRK